MEESSGHVSSSTSIEQSESKVEMRSRKGKEPGDTVGGTTTSTTTDANISSKPDTNSKNATTTKKPVTGIIPDTGEKFVVPETLDMVSNLFDIRVKKSYFDYIIVTVLISYVGLFFVLPKSFRIPIFSLLFAFWRLSYNGGIGWLLDQQSKHKGLTKFARDSKIFQKSDTWIHKFLYQNFTTQMGDDYDFYKVPLEYNTWLLFRSFVDLVLMSDFTCYMMLVLSCWSPTNHSLGLVGARWFAGLVLFFFNLWVKVDAHRVVKDYAWYWGDFFFLEDLDLTFDGVFQMAPHPMYSIGYVGYYGFCLITASYTLFFASVLAHALQFVFLIVVENPHIDKTYNSKPVKKSRLESFSSSVRRDFVTPYSGSGTPVASGTSLSSLNDSAVDESESPLLRSPLLLFKNFNPTRTSDSLLLASAVLLAFLAFGKSRLLTLITFVLALAIRLFHNVGLGYLLHEQSENKLWTRIFLKYGRSAAEAYEEWQVLYNASTVLSYVSLVVYFVRQYESPINAGVPFWPFRYIIGTMLIALQIWTSYSIYESLGNYGWFFGDFFYLKEDHALTFSGIYRYLNNPERLFGIAGVWGVALISNSFSIAFLAFVWTIGQISFIKFVEQPHMQKLYGNQIKHEAGVVKTIREAAKLPPPIEGKVKQLHGSLDKVLMETSSAVEAFLGQAKPKVSDAKKAVNETKVFLKQYPARLTIQIEDGMRINTALYDLEITTKSLSAVNELDGTAPLRYELGSPISVIWKADTKHSLKDWIGVYHVSHNQSAEVTRVSSKGLWSAVNRTGFSTHNNGIRDEKDESGMVEFSGAILPWHKGVYEFRYHHNGKHNVLAISRPFEICVTTAELSSDAKELATSLLSRVAHCFDGLDINGPTSVEELWDVDDDVLLERLAYLIKEAYGVELAPSVILSCKSVYRLAVKLVSVNQALLPLTHYKRDSSEDS